MSGYVAPGILSFVVAYDGPAQMATVRNWVRSIEMDYGLNASQLPQTRRERTAVLSESVEGVFVLGRGSVIFDNAPISLMTDAVIPEHPTAKYMTFSGAEGNLLLFFLLLTQAGSNTTGQWANLLPYIQRSQWKADLD